MGIYRGAHVRTDRLLPFCSPFERSAVAWPCIRGSECVLWPLFLALSLYISPVSCSRQFPFLCCDVQLLCYCEGCPLMAAKAVNASVCCLILLPTGSLEALWSVSWPAPFRQCLPAFCPARPSTLLPGMGGESSRYFGLFHRHRDLFVQPVVCFLLSRPPRRR